MLDHVHLAGDLPTELWYNLVGSTEEEVLRLLWVVVLVLGRRWAYFPTNARLQILIPREEVLVTLSMPVEINWVRSPVVGKAFQLAWDWNESIFMRAFSLFAVIKARLFILHELHEARFLRADIARLLVH